jgi:glycosyltransferase involved in cell wall biosynthesis
LLVPLQSGAGLRVKILEALAMGTPVITTPQGLEGIPAVSGEQLLIAGDARSFADAMLELERDPERASALAARGREWAARQYSWEKLGAELDGALAAAVAARGRR